MNTQDPTYQQNSKSICSPEQNYFVLFAMRYPVSFSYLQLPNLGLTNNHTRIHGACMRTIPLSILCRTSLQTELTGSTLGFFKWGENCLTVIVTQQTTNFFNRGVYPLFYVIATTQQTPEIGLILVGKTAAFTFHFLFCTKKIVVNINQKIIFAKLAI